MVDTTHPDTILFIDLDGTIVENPFASAVFPHFADRLSPYACKNAQCLVSEFNQEWEKRLFSNDGNAGVVMDWDDIVRSVMAGYSVTLEDGAVTDAVKHYCHSPYIRELDDASGVLRALTAAHRNLVVASMGLSCYQMPVLKALDLDTSFDDFLMPDLTGFLKTDRRFYIRYLDSCRLRISIGDNYLHDVVRPKQFGWLSVLVARIPALQNYDPFERMALLNEFSDELPGFPSQRMVLPDAVITHLSELPAVIDALEAQSLIGLPCDPNLIAEGTGMLNPI